MKRFLLQILCFSLLSSITISANGEGATSPIGWYRTPDGSSVLVSPGPGGSHRRLDFDHASFGSIQIGDEENAFRWIAPAEGEAVLVSPDGARWTRDPDAPYQVESVTFRSADGVRLAGILLRPSRPAGRGAVMIHGSGSSDRDNVWAYTFAHALAVAGVDVLFPDKRGSGDSEGDWKEVGFDALARDAVAGFDLLVETAGLDPGNTGWVGLSQGGWIAPLAARFSGRGGFVVSISSAAVPVFDQIGFEIRNTMEGKGFSQEAISSAMALQKLIQEHALGRLSWIDYEKARQAALEGPAAPFAEVMPSEPDDWRWRWWARVGEYDPIRSWGSDSVPTLVLYGAEDEQDNVPVATSVGRLAELEDRPGNDGRISAVVLPGMGHMLVDPEREWVSRHALSLMTDFVRSPDARTAEVPRAGEVRIDPRIELMSVVQAVNGYTLTTQYDSAYKRDVLEWMTCVAAPPRVKLGSEPES